MSSTAQMFVELEEEERQKELEERGLDRLGQFANEKEQSKKELEQARLAGGLGKPEYPKSDKTQQVGSDITCEADKLDQHLQGKHCLLAAERNQLQRLVWIIHYNPELVHFADADGYTPLHRASYSGHLDCARYLVKHGANLEAKTNDDWTPLHCAVRWNNLEVAEYLIEQGADINAKSSGGNTPLHIAASNGRYSITCCIIQMLLYHPDCDYWCRNQSGDTALALAQRSGPFYKLWTGVMTLMPDNDDCPPMPDGDIHGDAAT